MSQTSTLAAVAAAAAATTALTAWSDLTLEALTAHRPDLVLAVQKGVNVQPQLDAARADGARLESERIAGVMAKAKLAPGHDALVAEMVKDGKTSPDQAASRLLEADAAVRTTRAAGLKDADAALANVRASPSSGTATVAASTAATPEAWKAEYAASTALQHEFMTVEGYVAFKRAESTGKIKVLKGREAA